MNRRFVFVLFAAAGLWMGSCGGKTQQAVPTKAALVQTLRDLLAALEAGDDERALTYLFPLPGVSLESLPDLRSDLLKRGEISADGIDYLEQTGEFGELDDLLRDRGKAIAARAGVNENHCYVLTEDDAEAVGLWDGERFRILYLDDIGKTK